MGNQASLYWRYDRLEVYQIITSAAVGFFPNIITQVPHLVTVTEKSEL
jgi:hypothetical protein